MFTQAIKKILPYKWKRGFKEHLGVPSLRWSLQNLKRKNFNPAVIMDIGAYEGQWAVDALEVYPDAKILMVEAQPGKTPYLDKIRKRYPTTDYAISLLSGIDGAILPFVENETASHIVGTKEQGIKCKQMATQTLDVLAAIKQFPLPDLLKLDVQGHEMEVLKGAKSCLAHATVCLLEISLLNLGDDSPLLAEMIAFMDQNGFQAYDISQMMRRPFDNALYQVDVFFVKKDSRLIADKTW